MEGQKCKQGAHMGFKMYLPSSGRTLKLRMLEKVFIAPNGKYPGNGRDPGIRILLGQNIIVDLGWNKTQTISIELDVSTPPVCKFRLAPHPEGYGIRPSSVGRRCSSMYLVSRVICVPQLFTKSRRRAVDFRIEGNAIYFEIGAE